MRHPRITWAVACLLGLFMLILAGCGGSGKPAPGTPTPGPGQTSPAGGDPTGGSDKNPNNGPEQMPEPKIPNLQGDMDALRAALGEPTEVTYSIILANDAPQGSDRTQYLDGWLDEKGYPEKTEVLLFIFPHDNHDIRFAMGSLLFEKKVSLGSMLSLVRTEYLTKAQKHDPAGGLADLIRAINEQIK